jgi:predicted RNase H-like nuclease (RuvC/YqgF family)
MERNRWETAIRCLEVALHPHTADDEVVAAVRAFRRVVSGRPLRDICAALIGAADDVVNPAVPTVLGERLSRENGELRRKLADAEAARTAVAENLNQAQRRLGESHAELRAARDEAAACARQIAELREAQARTIEHLRGENAELHRALDHSRRSAASGAVPSSFGTVLAATLQRAGARAPERAGFAGASGVRPSAAPDVRPGWVA